MCSAFVAPSAPARTADRRPSMKDFQTNDRVSHTRFGPGVVIDVDARYTIIEFDDAGVRKFVTALVQLERSDLPVPVKPSPQRGRRAPRRRSVGAEPQPGSQAIQPDATPDARQDLPEPEEST
jgi:hypothetical protein